MSEPTSSDDWSAGSPEGLRLLQERDIAALTPQQRVDWLEQALDLALESGALARVRAERAARARMQWEQSAR